MSIREAQKHTPSGGGLALPYLRYMLQSSSLLRLEIPLSHGLCSPTVSRSSGRRCVPPPDEGRADPGEDVSVALRPFCPACETKRQGDRASSGGVADRVASVPSSCLSLSGPDETADESSPKSSSVCSISLPPQLFVFVSVSLCVCLCFHACSFQSYHS